MTAKKRLIPQSEVRAAIELMRDLGIEPGAVDVRSDGITIYPKSQSQSQSESFDAFKKLQSNFDRSARR